MEVEEDQPSYNTDADSVTVTSVSNSVTSMTDLPWDDVIITHIFPHLSIVDIFRLRSMNKDYRSLVRTYFHYQQHLDWSHVTGRVTLLAFKIATGNAENLIRLVVTSCRGWLSDALLVRVIRRNSRLQHIDMSECSGLSGLTMNMIAGTCPDLRVILLRDCHWVTPSMVKCLAMKCTRLEGIDLTGCWELNDDTVCFLGALQPQLRWVSLAKIYGITQVSVVQLAMNCFQLEYLDLEGCWRVTDAAIDKLAQNCPSLKMLRIRDCRNITERSLRTFRKRGVSIDVLAKPQCIPTSHTAQGRLPTTSY